jgi:EAL domain-containing protein (putative c-di-GMP-specific phosphodiesterase class I)
MYRAKESGRNNYQFFAPAMNNSSYERLNMENKLRRALERQEFVLHYQPQVNSESGLIIGAEALVRWRHPEMGLVPPGMFIPITEESGLIVTIGEWVLWEACRQSKAWQQEGLSPITVAVNLSAVQFHQKNLTEMVANVLQKTGLEPHWLELEITESGIMQNSEAAVKTLHLLKQMGLKLSIDDFGTGYSSLSYLKKFPIDKLKIDQSFVRDITTDQDDAAIVGAIIGMAKALKLRVIAEGVETRDHLDYLNSNGCFEIQGYYFSKPVPADEFGRLLLRGILNEAKSA